MQTTQHFSSLFLFRLSLTGKWSEWAGSDRSGKDGYRSMALRAGRASLGVQVQLVDECWTQDGFSGSEAKGWEWGEWRLHTPMAQIRR